MRLLFCSLCLLLIAAPVRAQEPVDVVNYVFSLTLSNSSDEIRGMAEITVELQDIQPPCTASGRGDPACAPRASVFWLDLVGRDEGGKGMQVDSVVTLSPASSQKRVRLLGHNGGRLNLEAGYWEAGDVRRFRVYYHGIPADGLIIAQNKHGRRTFFGDNWPDRARHWLPTVDHPGDKATVSWQVTAPPGYGIVANGRRMASWCDAAACHAHYRSDVPLPTKVMVIGAAPFAVEQAGVAAGVPVESWVYEEDRTNGFREYAAAVPILAYFDSLLAPFPYEKLANVQSKTRYGGMENAGAIFYHENSTPGDGSQEGLLAHEIVHQWFGDWATEADWPHLWLSEGFATYLTEVWFEHKEGSDRLRTGMAEARETVLRLWRQAPAPLVDTVYVEPVELLTANVYQRGAWVLHMLRHRLGDAEFYEGVRGYLLRHGGRNATTADFRAAMEAVSGQDLGSFFQQWTRRAGQPRLEGTWRYDAAAREVVVTVRQAQEAPAFVFPLDVQVGDATETVTVDELSETFRFRTPTRPARVVLDPHVRLLYEDGGFREAR
ncbi:MAG TPA: M1 family aminopeptidase [Rhodothermales bacterium]|nr:M1 family aminopeptidase [Rhodothermales bacterium]